MAKVKFSALISDMRGKLNGSVFAQNRGGSYLRNKVTPSNPNTASQAEARTRLSTFAQAWRGLTETQRKAWNAAVGNWARTNIFGDIKNPTGLQLYIRLNANIDIASGSAISLPPLAEGVTPVTSVGLTADGSAQHFELEISPDPVPAEHALVVEATAAQSAGVNNANSQFRIIQVVPAGAVPADSIAAYTAKFGALVTGQKYFVRVKMIRVTTGEVSGTQTTSAIAS